MMIEILVVRDPDGDDEIQAWHDGQPVAWPEVRVVVVDAGRGHEYDDWQESAKDAFENIFQSPKACRAAFDAYADPPGKEYIEGWPYDEDGDDEAGDHEDGVEMTGPYIARCTMEALSRPPHDQDPDNWWPWSTYLRSSEPKKALAEAITIADIEATQTKAHRGRVSIVGLNGVVLSWEGEDE